MLLRSIRLKNILSFRDTTVQLKSLNVLIGPNGVGKSNLIEVVRLLKAAPTDINRAIVEGGGAQAWISKAEKAPRDAIIECRVADPAVVYTLRFTESDRGFQILHESLQSASSPKQRYFEREGVRGKFGAGAGEFSTLASVLSQVKRPDDPTPITRLGKEFDLIHIYSDFNTGARSGARRGVATTAQAETLDEDGQNLAMVLHDMNFNGSIDRIKEYLRQFNENYQDVRIQIASGVAQTYIVEGGLASPVPATRLSDGMLKFLCLLAVLFNPSQRSVVCIQEPELGLHPDAMRLVAKALKEASEQMQLIVTTHSRELVDELSDEPEAVIVCERDFDNSTSFKRLRSSDLDLWLERYSLGDLWRKGEIGGNRW